MSETWVLEQGAPASSHTEGAKWLMSGHNAFGHVWFHGSLEGPFGPAAAEAARKCKWDIGYPEDQVQPTFGSRLAEFLTGKRAQTTEMAARVRNRNAKFVWPTKPRGTIIGRPGQGTHSYTVPPNNWESDNAYDIYVPQGSAVVAVSDGKIGPAFGRLSNPGSRFQGIRLHLETLDNELYYSHLRSTESNVEPGRWVKQGQLLGRSGEASGVAHLHFGMKHLVDISTFR